MKSPMFAEYTLYSKAITSEARYWRQNRNVEFNFVIFKSGQQISTCKHAYLNTTPEQKIPNMADRVHRFGVYVYSALFLCFFYTVIPDCALSKESEPLEASDAERGK